MLDQWKERLFANLAARATARFPKTTYWIAQAVGAENIYDDEDVFAVPHIDVLHRQFLRTKGLAR